MITPSSRKLLERAFRIIRRERDEMIESYKEADGTIRDFTALTYLRRYDAFLRPAGRYLGKRHKA